MFSEFYWIPKREYSQTNDFLIKENKGENLISTRNVISEEFIKNFSLNFSLKTSEFNEMMSFLQSKSGGSESFTLGLFKDKADLTDTNNRKHPTVSSISEVGSNLINLKNVSENILPNESLKIGNLRYRVKTAISFLDRNYIVTASDLPVGYSDWITLQNDLPVNLLINDYIYIQNQKTKYYITDIDFINKKIKITHKIGNTQFLMKVTSNGQYIDFYSQKTNSIELCQKLKTSLNIDDILDIYPINSYNELYNVYITEPISQSNKKNGYIEFSINFFKEV
jgi:hypothetical protein